MRYTATLTDGITDAHATTPNPIVPLEWSFTTSPRARWPRTAELAVYGFREKTGVLRPQRAALGVAAEARRRTASATATRGSSRGTTRSASVWVDSQGSSLGGDTVHLDREVQDLEPKGWAIFETATGAAVYYVTACRRTRSPTTASPAGRRASCSPSATAARRARARARRADFRVRETAAHVRSERLEAGRAADRRAARRPATREIVLDDMVVGLEQGRLIALRGELRRPRPARSATRSSCSRTSMHAGGFTTLVLEQGPDAQLRPQDRHAERQRRPGDARRDGAAARSSAAATARRPTSASRCAGRRSPTSRRRRRAAPRARSRSASTACAGTRRPCSTASARAAAATSCGAATTARRRP